MDSGKCLHHRRRRTISCAGLLIAALSVSGLGRAQSAEPSTVSSIDALEQFAATVATLSATFEQELWTADQQLIETVTGQFFLKRPNRFYWHYQTPPEQYVVADGQSLWMYDIELAQVTVAPLDDLSAASPAMLLSGESAVADSFELTESYELNGGQWIKLTPRDSSGDFSSVLIEFRDDAPQVLEIVDGLNQTTRISFTDVQLNIDVDDELFDFDPPADAHVIGGGR